MHEYSLYAETIKERVSMPDAINMYAPNPAPRHNRIPCPVHGGKNFNMSFTDKFYHCFKCNDGGDVIRFVQHVFGISFPEAIERLNSDFSCGLVLDRRPTLREQRDAQKRHEAIIAERERKEAEQQAYEDLYHLLWDNWIRLDRQRMDYEPKSPDEEISPLYAEAVRKIDYAGYLIDSLL